MAEDRPSLEIPEGYTINPKSAIPALGDRSAEGAMAQVKKWVEHGTMGKDEGLRTLKAYQVIVPAAPKHK